MALRDRVILPGMSAEDAFKLVAIDAAEEFGDRLTEIMSDDDPSHTHQARIALRRFRAALAGFGCILDAGVAAELKRQARRLLRLMGPLRDADVLVEQSADAGTRRQRLAAAAAVRDRTRRRLTLGDAKGFPPKVSRLLNSKAWRGPARETRHLRKGPVRAVALTALDAAWEPLAGTGAGLTEMSDAARHQFRRRLKTLRYQAEFFGPLWPGERTDRCVTRLKLLQDDLGTLNDMTLHPSIQPSEAKDALIAGVHGRWLDLASDGAFWRAGTAPRKARVAETVSG